MEPLDTIVTYTLDLVLGGSALYLGGSLTLFLAERWKKLEPKSKVKAPQAVNIPLQLKASVAEAIPLEAELQEVRSLEAMPMMPPMPSMPEARPLAASPLPTPELQLFDQPESIEPAAALPELQLTQNLEDQSANQPEASESPTLLPELQLAEKPENSEPSESSTRAELQLSEPPQDSNLSTVEQETLWPEPFSELLEPLYAENTAEDTSSEAKNTSSEDASSEAASSQDDPPKGNID